MKPIRTLGILVAVLAALAGLCRDAQVSAQPAKSVRKVPAGLAALPAPKAGGPLRILLVDDNGSPNNMPGNQNRNAGSDDVYRALVAAAVQGNGGSSAIEVVEYRKDGPQLERLREFNVVVWYTGDAFGSDADTFSRRDEDTARKYLQQTGGAFVLISPGYVNNLVYGAKWSGAAHPFLNEVMGVDGVAPFVQRFATGRVRATNGSEFAVVEPGVAETQFSAVNPDGAAIVFTATLDPERTAPGPVPVAVANPFGSGRFVYVGFTLENVPDADRARAFALVLDAATGRSPVTPGQRTTQVSPSTPAPAAATPAATTSRTPVSAAGGAVQTLKPLQAGPPITGLAVNSLRATWHRLTWNQSQDPTLESIEVQRREADGWHRVVIITSSPAAAFDYEDHALLQKNSAYRLLTNYKDGRQGEAIVEYPNPPQARAAKDFTAVQTGPGEVQLHWTGDAVQGSEHNGDYRVFGPTLPSAGSLGAWGARPTANPADGRYTQTVSGLPPGTHTFTLVADYWYKEPAPSYAMHSVLFPPEQTATVTVVPADRGIYRILLLGLRVITPVADDLLDGDGNEMFAGALLLQPTRAGQSWTVTRKALAETRVYGDSRNFPDRIRAGTAGPGGGLRAGDFVPGPEAQGPQPGVAGESDRFPLKVFEGELVDSFGHALIPFVIEWNNADHSTLSQLADFWSIGTKTPEQLADALYEAGFKRPISPQPMYGTVKIQDFSKLNNDPTMPTAPLIPHFAPTAGVDRLIGMMAAAEPKPFQEPVYGYNIRGLAIERQAIEASIPAGSSIFTVQQNIEDIPPLNGRVTAYYQIERLSPAVVFAPKE